MRDNATTTWGYTIRATRLYVYDIHHPRTLSSVIPARNRHIFGTVLTPVYTLTSLFVSLIVKCKLTTIESSSRNLPVDRK